MKITLIGGSGFVGSRIILDNPKLDFHNIDKANSKVLPEKTSICNIENKDKLRNCITSSSVVVHLAAEHKDNVTPVQKYYDVNVQGTKNIIRAIINSTNPPKWFFYASTSHVYPSNLSSKKLSRGRNAASKRRMD